MKSRLLVSLLAPLLLGSIPAQAEEAATVNSPIHDLPFVQEHREFFANPFAEKDSGADDIRDLAVDGAGGVWIAARTGVFRLFDGEWSRVISDERTPSYAAETDSEGRVWLGVWNGLYVGKADGSVTNILGVEGPISALDTRGPGLVAMGPKGLWREEGGAWKRYEGQWARSPRGMTRDAEGDLWVATDHGLYEIRGSEVLTHLREEADISSGELFDAATDPDGKIWVCHRRGIDVFENGKRIQRITPKEGLPFSHAQSLDFDSEGKLWAGTVGGAARFDGSSWSLRHGKRWLPHDEVRDVAFDSEGTAWVATAKGISAIKRSEMTLAEKANVLHAKTMARHVRPPWLVEKSRLLTPGDLSTSSYEDDDNDGEYTECYLAMEAFRYAVTGDPEARANAVKAFDAMEFLQTVTETDGFIARTVVPVKWAAPDNPNKSRLHDRNRTYTEQDVAEALVNNPRFKRVEERWRPSADGKWLWKGDTSSDETTAHFFGYHVFHDLVAETSAEKQRAKDLTRRVMDKILADGFTFKDIDGTHTLWGVWSPEKLMGDPDWRAERPLNCLEALSYLKTTYALTGEEKYEQAYRELIDKHGYANYARAPKPTAPSERTHIDSDLLVLTFPAVLKYEDDPKLQAIYQEGLAQWFSTVENEFSPWFAFVCGAYGQMDIGAEKCVEYLRDAPLDLIRWTVDNSKREDIELVRDPEPEFWQTDRLLPASERAIMRSDTNPLIAVSGDGGRTEDSGVYWLLGYWAGRYYGFIEAPGD